MNTINTHVRTASKCPVGFKFHSHVFRLYRLVLVARDFRGLLSDLVDPLDQVVQEFPLRLYFHEGRVHQGHQQDPQDLFECHVVQLNHSVCTLFRKCRRCNELGNKYQGRLILKNYILTPLCPRNMWSAVGPVIALAPGPTALTICHYLLYK